MRDPAALHLRLDPRLRSRFELPLGDDGAHVIGAGYMGSHSHNTYVPKDDPDAIDDVDIFAVVLPPLDHLIGLHDWQHQVIQVDELDAVFFSYHKAVKLLLNANPNVLGFLWLEPEHYIIRAPALDRLIAARDAFSSQRAGASFAGYAQSQLKKMEGGVYRGYMGEKRKELVQRFGYDTKHASHLIRLLTMGIEFLETGNLQVYRSADADLFRAIKRGDYALDSVRRLATQLDERFAQAREHTRLPERPDFDRVNALVVQTVREHICQDES